MTLKFIVDFLSALCAFLAAVLWFKSAKAYVDAKKVEEESVKQGKGSPFQITCEDGSDFIETAKLQTKWSRRASIAAGFAALFQAIGVFL